MTDYLFWNIMHTEFNNAYSRILGRFCHEQKSLILCFETFIQVTPKKTKNILVNFNGVASV